MENHGQEVKRSSFEGKRISEWNKDPSPELRFFRTNDLLKKFVKTENIEDLIEVDCPSLELRLIEHAEKHKSFHLFGKITGKLDLSLITTALRTLYDKYDFEAHYASFENGINKWDMWNPTLVKVPCFPNTKHDRHSYYIDLSAEKKTYVAEFMPFMYGYLYLSW